ncbi:MAG: lipid A biosynthesis acyltransferase [Fibrobacteraceae bacterium]|nr:lipid A biosynthesis acyltransferase [Fibrobacteraceae bacterium]
MASALHWSKKKEHGLGNWQFRFFSFVVCKCPWPLTSLVVAIVTFFFFLAAKEERRISREYLKRVFLLSGKKPPTNFDVYKHILAFSFSMVEKISSSENSGSLSSVETKNDDLHLLVEQLNAGKGACLLCSHLGNVEILRALAHESHTHASRSFKVFPVIDLSCTAKFNSILKQLNPSLMGDIVDANSVGTDTIIWMKEQIDQGNMVVIAGDRTSAHTENRTVTVPFLGAPAAFPVGSFLLVSLLNAPIYYVFGLRKRDLRLHSKCEMCVEKASVEISGPRKEREARLQKLISEYAEVLGKHCAEHPYQWYNFYEFWNNKQEDKK